MEKQHTQTPHELNSGTATSPNRSFDCADRFDRVAELSESARAAGDVGRTRSGGRLFALAHRCEHRAFRQASNRAHQRGAKHPQYPGKGLQRRAASVSAGIVRRVSAPGSRVARIGMRAAEQLPHWSSTNRSTCSSRRVPRGNSMSRPATQTAVRRRLLPSATSASPTTRWPRSRHSGW